ncbi:uncharacterized protein LOC128760972 [Synchiropus splendidus]|uniref:uncharacterized protein LOC128760972 n=1 Tax=Synchiropus splendidus TaxID=270530 RepID=UPI00237D46B3|nr:uncharacterized protein LOC128760972 [Synchiropus splendidus]
MEVARILMLYAVYQEMEEEIEQQYQRQLAVRRRRRRALYCRYLCQRRGEKPRHYCSVDLTVPVLQRYFAGEDTRPDLGVSREVIHELLRSMKSERHHGWGPTLETLAFLFWLATGSSYRIVSLVFSMPLPTVHRIIHRMTEELLELLPRFVHLPDSEEEVKAIGDGFARLSRHSAFAKAAGALDCCHIRIKSPGGPEGQDYQNRSLFPSVVLQAVCDHQGCFLDIFVGYPGGVHGAHVLTNSPIYCRGSYPPPGFFLLADGYYPCLDQPLALITPFKWPVKGVEEELFNYHHAKGHATVQLAFAKMKTRFRCIFLDALEVQALFVPKVVTACVILHNICLRVGDDLVENVMEEDNQPTADCDGGQSPSGAEWRAALAREVSTFPETPMDHDYVN